MCVCVMCPHNLEGSGRPSSLSYFPKDLGTLSRAGRTFPRSQCVIAFPALSLLPAKLSPCSGSWCPPAGGLWGGQWTSLLGAGPHWAVRRGEGEPSLKGLPGVWQCLTQVAGHHENQPSSGSAGAQQKSQRPSSANTHQRCGQLGVV